MYPIHDVANTQANLPGAPQQGRDGDEAIQPELQPEELPELPDPAEVGESG
jgi:hypothetical protein